MGHWPSIYSGNIELPGLVSVNSAVDAKGDVSQAFGTISFLPEFDSILHRAVA